MRWATELGNFREQFTPRTRVNKGKETGQGYYAPALVRASSR
jgi:hypothetical protein